MKRITSRFAMLLATAAVVPLLVYGVVSVISLREGTRRSVIEGNLNVARRAAEQIQLYITNNIKILQAVGADLQGTSLERWQQDRILKGYVLRFQEFREVTLFDSSGAPVVSSRIGRPGVKVPASDRIEFGGVSMSPITIDNDLLPTAVIAVRLTSFENTSGWLVGEFSLEELWRMVDRIRVGERGFVLLVAGEGQLLAHGDPDQKPRVARGDNLIDHPVVQAVRTQQGDGPVWKEFGAGDDRVLAVAARIDPLNWTVIVELPASEAFAVARQLERQLFVAIGLVLLTMITVGYFWGRSFLTPIFALMRGTRALAEGRLEERVTITGGEEFRQLGAAFNTMADRLIELQENVRKQERQAMFGRIAAGLVHDLSHPIQNIGNSCKLILKMFEDPDYRETFKRTVDREFATLKRVLEDLRNIARPIPLERFPIDVNRSVLEVVEAMRSSAERAGVALEPGVAPDELFIEGDVFALGRVYRNLIVNAIQATAPGGAITLTTDRRDGQVEIRVADTGCGIPPERLPAIFEDFVTTKRRGLGLGLAISKKIVEQLGGTITVTSEVGRGTTFVMRFQATRARPAQTAAVAG